MRELLIFIFKGDGLENWEMMVKENKFLIIINFEYFLYRIVIVVNNNVLFV